ncbi:MAG: phosphatase PAP2 family protein [Alphaproteobacteria bacterium]|jgi:hypothetical protein|nr:phosphatase PAP2 family protein [Alphaproteobacteria bacterium]MCL2757898.1 phosphatase PAP2 family protein [Alphaproteobacteria bacterium]
MLVRKIAVFSFTILIGLNTQTASGFFGSNNIESVGDYLQVILPAYALGMAVQEEGWEGVRQFGYSFGAMQLTVELMKQTINAERPDGSDNRSFPSGHTAAAFSGATFIHKRYGWQRAVVPYMLAGFAGYSRVHANKHYWHDVVAGAAISSLLTWTLTSRYSNYQVSASPTSVSLGFRTDF